MSDTAPNVYETACLRAQRLATAGDGILTISSSPLHHVAVCKEDGHVQLIFLDETSHEVQGLMDPARPFDPVTPYAQAALLGLALKPGLCNAFCVGLGAAVIQKALWRFLPGVAILTAELDPAIPGLAEDFFALALDERQSVAVGDGRAVLEQNSGPYGLIVIDAFRGTGYGPYRLATAEFYALCRSRMAADSVLVVNVLRSDGLFGHKALTLESSFRNVLAVPLETQAVFLATDSDLPDNDTLVAKALRLEQDLGMPFSLAERAGMSATPRACPDLAEAMGQGVLLTDAKAPDGYFQSLSPDSVIYRKAAPDDPCPCGSGLRLARCHGAQGRGRHKEAP